MQPKPQTQSGRKITPLVLSLLLVCFSSGDSFSQKAESMPSIPHLYQEIIDHPRNGEKVAAAVKQIAKIYEKRIMDGDVFIETEREVLLKAFPVIIDSMKDDNVWSAFRVLAYVQSECPAPEREVWEKWWARKEAGGQIRWVSSVLKTP